MHKKDDFNDFLEELKYKCDIVTIVSQYIPLTKKSGKHFGCCPFHNEKTPSFCVNSDGQYYHCFGCGVSGNVINFVMETESLGFMDAVRFLADKAGMTVPEYNPDPDREKKKERGETLKQLMRDAARYYRNNLLHAEKGREAREYLQSRGINEDISARYGLGLSLGYDGIYGYLRRKGYSDKDLGDCGVVSAGSSRDAFANRIIVPIFNPMNEVIAFGGRVYHGEKDVAKYKNSTNTALFDKSRTIYGVNFVKKEKREHGGFTELILVEGYMDVISLGAAGIRNAVAGMGTALTDGQAQELKRLAPSVLVCYDGDQAGRKAAVKNVEPLLKCGLDVKVVSLPDGCDPDDTVRQEGRDGFQSRLGAALPVIEYKLKLCEEAYDLKTLSGRAKYVTAALRVLKDVESAAEREVYFKAVSDKGGVSVATLTEEYEKGAPKQKKEAPSSDKESTNLIAARFVLNRMLNNAEYADPSDAESGWFIHTSHRAVFDFIRNYSARKVIIGDMFPRFDGDSEAGKIIGVNSEVINTFRESEYYYDCMLTIANEYISSRLELLKASYGSLSEPEQRRAALLEIQELQRKLKSKNLRDKH